MVGNNKPGPEPREIAICVLVVLSPIPELKVNERVLDPRLNRRRYPINPILLYLETTRILNLALVYSPLSRSVAVSVRRHLHMRG